MNLSLRPCSIPTLEPKIHTQGTNLKPEVKLISKTVRYSGRKLKPPRIKPMSTLPFGEESSLTMRISLKVIRIFHKANNKLNARHEINFTFIRHMLDSFPQTHLDMSMMKTISSCQSMCNGLQCQFLYCLLFISYFGAEINNESKIALMGS